ncbi:MAG: TetM/TetW/TetO/TetS family tetracycline resistance ribosomal protection protein, partial [Erysipelotrichaceae bacterium]|nr:TetM/TetW/TetO/TetS family tetracycline resistance ribosomal protection protein [Erysipelotrichaceae bacterium]
MKTIVSGILAHVDAGKTTLSESMLYTKRAIMHQGRVDHRDTFLDFDVQERRRGITIYSKVFELNLDQTHITFIDTPGHVDFSGEMERALSVLDYAVLMISSLDGIQAHTKTIWSLLDRLSIPTFIFVNKMDVARVSREELLNNLKTLSPDVYDFTNVDHEELSMIDEELLEEYMELGHLSTETLAKAIKQRLMFPCFFGSALRNEGVDVLLESLDTLTLDNPASDELSALVYKIAHDDKGERLTYVKVNGGTLTVRQSIGEEKIHQIRRYQGDRYQLQETAHQGELVILTGLNDVQAGDVIGVGDNFTSHITPYLRYALHLSPDADQVKMMAQLKKLSEEEPLLDMTLDDPYHIEVSLMGEVQIETLKTLIKERFNEDVTIDQQRITYRETITTPVEGVGHFEPLRHYAEVHVLLEPLPPGSGLEFVNRCQTTLPERFQRLIMTHLRERAHRGVLTGSYITDIRFTLLGGRHHPKHTEGGDFRQATYRAVRQGLKMTESILLEPYAHYELHVPSQQISRVYFDFDNHGTPEIVSDNGEEAVLKGQAPMTFLSSYQMEVLTYTKGFGQLMIGEVFYAPCLNQDEVVVQRGYDSERDFYNPTGSVFCSHGAGFYVPYDQVADYMHIDYLYGPKKVAETPVAPRSMAISDEEVERVMTMTYGPVRTRLSHENDQPKEYVAANSV